MDGPPRREAGSWMAGNASFPAGGAPSMVGRIHDRDVMMLRLQLGFDLRAFPGGASHADLAAAALDMCEWADGLDGIDCGVRLQEHHGAPDGYLPSPIAFAAAVAGRTRRMRITAVVLMPLYDPIRLAEDLAILDLVSGGRFEAILAAGYRKEEFDMFGLALSDRGRRMEEGVDIVRKAWSGEPFAHRGTVVRVTPRPATRPHPPILLGGSSPAAARRAARIADGFVPSDPALMAVYNAERAALGREAGPPPKGGRGSGRSTLVAVGPDPDALWAQVGPHCLHEMNSYAAWAEGTPVRIFRRCADLDELRATGRYAVLTPARCVARAREAGGTIAINPLLGGIAPALGWKSLKRLEAEVLPALRA